MAEGHIEENFEIKPLKLDLIFFRSCYIYIYIYTHTNFSSPEHTFYLIGAVFLYKIMSQAEIHQSCFFLSCMKIDKEEYKFS